VAAALGALFAAMVAWAILSVEGPESRARATQERVARALPFSPGEVVSLEVAPRSGAALRLERAAGGWRLLAPTAGAAGAPAVEAFLERLSEMRVRGSVPAGPGAGAARGLDPPVARLTLSLRDGRTVALDLGDENPFDRTRFGRSGPEIRAIEGVPALAVDPDPEPFLAAPEAR
jgi:hypothetical protein